MKIKQNQIQDTNKINLQSHQEKFDFLSNSLIKTGTDVQSIVNKLKDFQVAIPSWALGAGGTRFGRFGFYGEPSNLEEKIDDIGVLHSLTQTAGAVSLHIPWDIPSDYAAIKEKADALSIKFDAVNSNTFQDQKDAAESYKYGSLSNTSKAVREQAIQHNLDVIKIGDKLGSKALTVWLADGSCFPGQNNFQTAFQNTQDSLIDIYKGLPDDWKMLVEYKPYEPNFYSTVIQDWGASLMLANGCGDKAYTLVDLGHHLPNSNIEQIVSILQLKGKLGGFHFNDSKYGDDDLTVGSIKPYALFLIFNELVYGMENNPQNPDLAWMIDASHNVKDPLEDLIQSLEAIQEAYAKALLIDQKALKAAQLENDVVKCQEILQGAYRTDVRPLLAEARLKAGGALSPIEAYRSLNVRSQLITERGKHTVATGLYLCDMKTKVTAVFDIGKTNKKFFLFDKDFKEVHKEYISFDEIVDEDGFPTENLPALQEWLKGVFDRILEAKEFNVKAINFSTYGASFVHIDKYGEPLTPLYNYLKPLDNDIIDDFFSKYGPKEEFLKTTGCADLSMLNSGLQLYWLKHRHPEVFKNIKYSLHLPQYLSYVFAGIPLSEYTSIGCHTALWDYIKKDYHPWVYEEELDKILPPIVSTETSINMNYNGKRIKIGVGIHDSSAALLPYVRSIRKKFVLVSTGTWSIVFNPFTKNPIASEEDDGDTINYMRINGKPVKATRLFLGNEYKVQVAKLDEHYGVNEDYHRTVKFNYNIYKTITDNFQYCYKWEGLSDNNMPDATKMLYDTYEYAYHQLMHELVLLQIRCVEQAVGTDDISRIYVDGGFSNNDVFIKLLSHSFRNKKLSTTDASLGSALGAAISISDTKLNSKFLKKNYALKKHVPFIISG